MTRCWCGRRHSRGCLQNGEVKHYVLNWKLYQLRKDGLKEEEAEENAGS